MILGLETFILDLENQRKPASNQRLGMEGEFKIGIETRRRRKGKQGSRNRRLQGMMLGSWIKQGALHLSNTQGYSTLQTLIQEPHTLFSNLSSNSQTQELFTPNKRT